MEKSFLQSPDWLGFQKFLGRKVWNVDGINIIEHNLPFGKSYFYSPRCGGNFLSEQFLNKVKEIAKQGNVIFLKVESQEKIDLKDSRFKKSNNIQPTKTIILDITKSEQELLNQMHYKTRYNIQLARKRGVEIRNPKSEIRNFEEFWRLMQETTRRDGFRPHPKEYYRKMLEIPGIELFVAEFQNKIIAANIVVFWEKTVIYLHGASDYEHRNLMAPHLLQWEQIQEAKKHGCLEYDFWGIDENKWPGVTRFKKGFGGKEIEYPGAYDLVFQPTWYSIYKIARKIL
jgi:lipid II:glycine glycyltransferase (peptidoglycan interpeptide bridge formation enzyme)